MIKSYTYKKTNRPFRILGLSIFITMVATIGFVVYLNHTANAGVTGWMPGRIIDDSVFTNYNSMSAAQIQTFLNSKVPVCDTNGTQPSEFGGGTRAQWAANASYHPLNGAFYPPFTCLKDYSLGGKTAAKIIYDTAQKYHINPQVLIVLLQKEQGLVTDTWPAPYQYQTATGYGCPDTAPCDTQYYGLTNQLDWSGKMFRRIMDNVPQSQWYTPYVLGDNYIKFHPDFWNSTKQIWENTCGGNTVFIQNRATQALYNYTPYQPNQAALDSGWGSAVCGAYGNRNFYLYFTNWFGAATSAATYGYSVVSTDIYSDYTYQTKMATPTLVIPSQEFYIKVVLKNTGNQAWYSNNLRLGTTNPNNRSSIFATGDWLNSGRPSAMSEDYVAGGSTATFTFKSKAPTSLGDYPESFMPLIEGYRWIGTPFTIPITVTSPTPYYSIQTQSFDVYSDSAMTKKLDPTNITKYTDSKIFVKAIIKNTGNQTLPADITKLAVTNPRDHASIYSDSSWLTNSRVTTAKEGDIAPQTTGTFSFTVTTPSAPLARNQEQFGLLIEGKRWLDDNIGTISIQTNQRPPSVLNAGQSINSGDILLSTNEKYKLILQGDGNLVLYSPTRAIWASWTVGKGGVRLVMQGDGNLVLYTNKGVAVWDSRTAGQGDSSVYVQGDGNLVVYGPKSYTWASWTSGRT